MTNQRGFALITLLVPLFAVLTGAAADAATMTSVTINTPNAQVTDPSAATLANDGNGYVAIGADVEILCGLFCFPNFLGNGQASASVGILRAGVHSTGSVDSPGWTAQAFFRDDFTLGGLPLGTVVSIGANLKNACRSEEHTSELQSLAYLVCRLLLEKKKQVLDCYLYMSTMSIT